jgi:hypothetical protein
MRVLLVFRVTLLAQVHILLVAEEHSPELLMFDTLLGLCGNGRLTVADFKRG